MGEAFERELLGELRRAIPPAETAARSGADSAAVLEALRAGAREFSAPHFVPETELPGTTGLIVESTALLYARGEGAREVRTFAGLLLRGPQGEVLGAGGWWFEPRRFLLAHFEGVVQDRLPENPRLYGGIVSTRRLSVALLGPFGEELLRVRQPGHARSARIEPLSGPFEGYAVRVAPALGAPAVWVTRFFGLMIAFIGLMGLATVVAALAGLMYASRQLELAQLKIELRLERDPRAEDPDRAHPAGGRDPRAAPLLDPGGGPGLPGQHRARDRPAPAAGGQHPGLRPAGGRPDGVPLRSSRPVRRCEGDCRRFPAAARTAGVPDRARPAGGPAAGAGRRRHAPALRAQPARQRAQVLPRAARGEGVGRGARRRRGRLGDGPRHRHRAGGPEAHLREVRPSGGRARPRRQGRGPGIVAGAADRARARRARGAREQPGRGQHLHGGAAPARTGPRPPAGVPGTHARRIREGRRRS